MLLLQTDILHILRLPVMFRGSSLSSTTHAHKALHLASKTFEITHLKLLAYRSFPSFHTQDGGMTSKHIEERQHYKHHVVTVIDVSSFNAVLEQSDLFTSIYRNTNCTWIATAADLHRHESSTTQNRFLSTYTLKYLQ